MPSLDELEEERLDSSSTWPGGELPLESSEFAFGAELTSLAAEAEAKDKIQFQKSTSFGTNC